MLGEAKELFTIKDVYINNLSKDIKSTKTGGTTMKKTLTIEGMMCKHCQAHAEKALNAMEGVTATVDLEAGSAYCEGAEGVTDEFVLPTITLEN